MESRFLRCEAVTDPKVSAPIRRQCSCDHRDSAHGGSDVAQGAGYCPSRTLPDELYAHGAVTPDGRHFHLQLAASTRVFGARSAGAPFNVYLRNLATALGMQAATYSVKADDNAGAQVRTGTVQRRPL
jgi:hypothetical protein